MGGLVARPFIVLKLIRCARMTVIGIPIPAIAVFETYATGVMPRF